MPTIDSDSRTLIRDKFKASDGKIWAATVAKVFQADAGSASWVPLAKAGALVFLRDGQDNIYLRLVDIDQPKGGDCGVLWEHELYLNFDYRKEKPYFYSFESDDRQYGLLFCDTREASEFAKHIRQRLCKIGRGMSSDAGETGSIHSNGSGPQARRSSSFFGSLFSGGSRDKDKEALPASPVKGRPSPPTGPEKEAPRRNSSSASLDRIREEDIGDPIGFQHLSHIGFNPATGVWDMQNIPPQWRRFFEAAGVGRAELESKETAGFIAEFVRTAQAEGRVAVNGKKGPPPPPPAKGTKPRPPSRSKAEAPVVRKGAEPPMPEAKPARPPSATHEPRPAVSKAEAPGPPPPPPPSFDDFRTFQQDRGHEPAQEETEEPARPSRPAAASSRPSLNDGLLQSIRAAALTDLRPVQRSETSASLASSTASTPTTDAAPGDTMAALLAQAMKARKRAVAQSDSEEEEEW